MTYRIPRQRCKLIRDGAPLSIAHAVSTRELAEAVFRKSLAGLVTEEFHVLALSNASVPVGLFVVARGSVAGAAFTPADVLRPVIVAGAPALIVAHNHPSGDPTPYRDDRAMTLTLARACRHIGLHLVDSLVLCPDHGTSASILDDMRGCL